APRRALPPKGTWRTLRRPQSSDSWRRQPPGRLLANRRRARDSARSPCRTIEKWPPGIPTFRTGRGPGRWPISPGPQAPRVRDALAPRSRSRPRGRVREVVTRRRYPHGRGGGVSTRGQPPRIASSPVHGRHRVGSTGTHARHTSRPRAKEWRTAPRGMSPPETSPSTPPRPRDPSPLEAQDRAPSMHSGIRRNGCGWRPTTARASIPPSGGGSRLTDWHAEAMRFPRTVSRLLVRVHSAGRVRWSPPKAEPAPRSPRHRAARTEAPAPPRGEEGEPAALRRNGGTDLAVEPNPGIQARRHNGGSGASFSRGKPPRLVRQEGRGRPSPSSA